MEHLTLGDGIAMFGLFSTMITGIIAWVKITSKKDNSSGHTTKITTALARSQQALDVAQSAATDSMCLERNKSVHTEIGNLADWMKTIDGKLDTVIKDVASINTNKS